MVDARKRSGASMSWHCLANVSTRNDDEPSESRLPIVYLTANGRGLPRRRPPIEPSAENDTIIPKRAQQEPGHPLLVRERRAARAHAHHALGLLLRPEAQRVHRRRSARADAVQPAAERPERRGAAGRDSPPPPISSSPWTSGCFSDARMLSPPKPKRPSSPALLAAESSPPDSDPPSDVLAPGAPPSERRAALGEPPATAEPTAAPSVEPSAPTPSVTPAPSLVTRRREGAGAELARGGRRVRRRQVAHVELAQRVDARRRLPRRRVRRLGRARRGRSGALCRLRRLRHRRAPPPPAPTRGDPAARLGPSWRRTSRLPSVVVGAIREGQGLPAAAARPSDQSLGRARPSHSALARFGCRSRCEKELRGDEIRVCTRHYGPEIGAPRHPTRQREGAARARRARRSRYAAAQQILAAPSISPFRSPSSTGVGADRPAPGRRQRSGERARALEGLGGAKRPAGSAAAPSRREIRGARRYTARPPLRRRGARRRH